MSTNNENLEKKQSHVLQLYPIFSQSETLAEKIHKQTGQYKGQTQLEQSDDLDLKIAVLKRITRKAKIKIEQYQSQKANFRNHSKEYLEIESKLNAVYDKWCDHTLRLGARPVSFGKCSFQTGKKSFLWEY